MEIRLRLAEEDPEEYEPDLAYALHKLAYTQYMTDDYDSSAMNYEKALKIRRRLAEEDPEEYEENLASTLRNYGNLEADIEGEEQKALELYREALEIYERLDEDDPGYYEDEINEVKESIEEVENEL